VNLLDTLTGARSIQKCDWPDGGCAEANMGAIETTCAEAPSKAKPNLRVVEFKKMEPAHV
jgi:hypothetical protein